MPFLTVEDFQLAPYNLPNLAEEEETFILFLTEQEEIALKNVLGGLLYSKFAADMLLDAEAQAQRFKDIRDGVVYTHNNVKYRWDGVVKALKPLVYFLWTTENIDSNSGLGIVEADSENSKVVSPAGRLSRAYNDYSRRIGNASKCNDSLFGYLWNSGDTYLEDIAEYDYTSIKTYLLDYFKNPGKINQFGL